MKNICIALVALLVTTVGAVAQEQGPSAAPASLGTRIGVYGAGALNFSTPEVQVWRITSTSNPLFERWITDSLRFNESSTCFAFVGGGMVGIPINEYWHFTGRVGVNWLNASSAYDQALANDSLLEHSWSASMVMLEMSPGIELHNAIPDLPLYFLAGLEFGFMLSSSHEQVTDLYISGAYLGQQVTTAPSANIPNGNVRAALMLGAGYTLQLDENIWLQPEVSYRLPMTEVSSNDQYTPWQIGQLRFGVNLTFNISSPDPEPEPELPSMGARIDRVTALDNSGREYEVESINVEDVQYTEMFPLVPYVFYPQNGATPAPEMQDLGEAVEGGFDPERLPLDAIEVNRNLLNIVGSRMSMDEFQHATLTITGVTDGKDEMSVPELGNRRALWAKDYLVRTYGIQPARISVQSRDLSERPSAQNDPDGIVENRRIELSSNVPDLLAPLTITAADQRVATPDVVMFHPAVENADTVDSWNLKISQAGRPLKELNGSGTPEKISWPIKPNDLSTAQVPVDYELTVRGADGREAQAVGSVPIDYLSSVQKRTENLPDRTIDKYSLILFDFNAATLTDDNRRILEQAVLPSIKANSTVSIIGYSDRIGSDDYNKKLSVERANTVSTFLSSRAKDAKYTTIGVGESSEIFPNGSPIGRQLSRTVQVIVETPRR